MTDLRYATHYALYGARLDIDAVLAKAKPRRPAEVWRRGEANAIGKKHLSSGLQIELSEGASVPAFQRAVRTFLEKEQTFLRIAASVAGPKVWSVISSGLFVHSAGPVTLFLPPDLMALAGRQGVGWSVTGYPCSD